MNSDEDPYKVLGLRRDASTSDIKAKYRELAKQHHPDASTSQAASNDTSARVFARIKEARDRLLHPQAASSYRAREPNSTSSTSSSAFWSDEFAFKRSRKHKYANRARSTSYFTRADARVHVALVLTMFVGPVLLGECINRAWSMNNRGRSLTAAKHAIEASKWRESSLSLTAEYHAEHQPEQPTGYKGDTAQHTSAENNKTKSQ